MKRQNIYLIWETYTNNNITEETFINVCWNLRDAKNWLEWTVKKYPNSQFYVCKHYRSIADGFGWREWRKRAMLDYKGKLKLAQA